MNPSQENKRLNPMEGASKHKKGNINYLLAFLLLAAVGFIVYQNYEALLSHVNSPGPSQPTASPHSTQGATPSPFVAEFDRFLTTLSSPQNSYLSAHQDLGAFLSNPQNFQDLTAQDISKYVTANKVPADYRYFLSEYMKNYVSPSTSLPARFSQKEILFSLAPGSYEAYLFFNLRNQPVGQLDPALGKVKRAQHIALSGTYTSPYRLPAGLAIDRGRVINPVLQSWDGLLLLQQGKLRISHLNELELEGRPYDLKHSHMDYASFLSAAKRLKVSVLQSHLLINHSSVLVFEVENAPKIRRRALFQQEDGSLHLYDSRTTPHTLFELAQVLKNTFQADRALNLDMGDYNYCLKKDAQGTQENLSELKAGVVISNFLVVDY